MSTTPTSSPTPAASSPSSGSGGIIGELHRVSSSTELAVILVALWALLTALGTLVVQNSEPAAYHSLYGVTLGRLILLTGFDDLFHSALYQFVMFLLGVNLALCILKRKYWNWDHIGHLTTHLSLLVIVAGGLVGSTWGDKGYVEIAEGQTVASYESRRGKGDQSLPFSLTLDDFTVTYKQPEHRLYVMDPAAREMVATAVLKEGKAAAFKGLPPGMLPAMTVVSLRHHEDVAGNADREPVYQGTLTLRIGKGSEERTVVLNYPVDNRLELGGRVVAYNVAPLIGEYRSEVTVTDHDGSKFSRRIIVNDPLEHAGVRIYQSNYRKDPDGRYRISGLEVVRDPGITLAFAGFWALMLGVFWLFYVRPYLRRRKGSAA